MMDKVVNVILALFIAAILGGVAISTISTQGTSLWSTTNVLVYGLLGTIGLVAVMVLLIRAVSGKKGK